MLAKGQRAGAATGPDISAGADDRHRAGRRCKDADRRKHEQRAVGHVGNSRIDNDRFINLSARARRVR